MAKISVIYCCQKKFQTLRIWMCYISVKASDIDIRIDYLFCKIILKFLDFMESTIFRKNQKSTHRIAKFEYFTKIVTYSKSLDHVSKSCIRYVHILLSLKFFQTSKNGLNLTIFMKIAHKVVKSKYLPNS